MAANDTQVGGTHYLKLDPHPWDVIEDWGLGFLDGTALKYISRWRDPESDGIEDLKKALHYLSKLIENEEAKVARHAQQQSLALKLREQERQAAEKMDIAEVAKNFQADPKPAKPPRRKVAEPGAPMPDLAEITKALAAAEEKRK